MVIEQNAQIFLRALDSFVDQKRKEIVETEILIVEKFFVVDVLFVGNDIRYGVVIRATEFVENLLFLRKKIICSPLLRGGGW